MQLPKYEVPFHIVKHAEAKYMEFLRARYIFMKLGKLS